MTSPPPRPRKHLMVPGEPPRGPTRGAMSLTSVQRWIMSTLATTTILHLAGGLAVAAAYVDERSSAIGLLVVAAAFGVVAFAAGLMLHRRSPASPLLLLGLVPSLVGAYLIF